METSTKIYEEVIYISCSWFCICFKRIYFGRPSDDCFWNVKNLFLTTIMYMTTSKSPDRTGLKRYLMNRSSRLLLYFLFWFAKTALIREEIVVLLKKGAAGWFRNLYKQLLKVYQDECITYSLNSFVMDLILKLWNIQGITFSVFEPILVTAKESLIIQDNFRV